MVNAVIIFVHLAAAAVAVGASVVCLLLLPPRVRGLKSEKTPDEHSVAYQMMDVLAPTVFVCMLLLVGSGVYYMMENYTDQVNLNEGYYNVLGIKLVFAIAAFFLSAYVTFGLRAKISHLDLRPENKKLVAPTLDTMRMLSQVALMAIGFALFMGIYLARY